MRRLLLVLMIAAGPASATSLSLDRGPVQLGKTESVGVTIRIDEAPGSEDRPLRLAVNVGSFGEVTRTKPGVYRSVYIPPATRFPQVALVAIWRETGPDAPIDFLKIQLYGATKLPISAKPNSKVTVQIGPDAFGPFTVDRTGRALLPVSVPPNFREAQLTVREPSGLITQKKLPIEVPQYNRLTAALVPHAVVADGTSWARLEVFYDLGGADVSADRIQPGATLGAPTLTRAERGRYTYRYVPPAGSTEKGVEFFVSVQGDGEASASAKLKLGLPAPARILVRAPEKPIAADGLARATVSALVLDSAGLALPDQALSLSANGEKVAPVVHRGNGVYEATFVAPRVYPPGGLVQFVATAAGVNGTANYQLQAAATPRGVTARLSPNPVPADGRTEATLSLDVRDGAGLPLEGARLILVASHGTLGELAEVGDGTYQARYTAPKALPDGDAVVRVVDPAGGFDKSLPLSLRERPGSILIGVRGGVAHSLGDQLGVRGGADLWVPFRIGSETFGVGASGEYARASQTVTDGVFSARADATFVPLAVRVGYELLATRRLSLTLGAGPAATFASVTTTLDSERRQGWGFGALGFAALGYAVGPGQAFVELSYAYAPVETEAFRLDGGGVALEVGYRFGIF